MNKLYALEGAILGIKKNFIAKRKKRSIKRIL
nr:hypothetical protein [Bifidobacterium breve]